MEPNVLNLMLPYPPALNNLYFTRILPVDYGKRRFKPMPIRVLSPAGLAYKATVAEIVDGVTPIVGNVAVTFRVYRPRRRGDLDGVFKIVLDSFTGFVYNDDEQISELHSYRFEDKYHPRLEIEIKALGLC